MDPRRKDPAWMGRAVPIEREIPGLKSEIEAPAAEMGARPFRFGRVPHLGMGQRIFADWAGKRLKSGVGWGFAGGLSGGYFQWVLDAVCETVEWSHQLLGFDSLALRAALD